MSASSILVSADRRAAGSVTPVVKLTITRQNLPGTDGTLKINNVNTSVTWIGSMGTADVHMAIAALDDNVCKYTCSYNGQTYSAVLTIKRKDDTEYGRFLGALASAPSNSGALDGDYFVWNGGSGYTKGVTYRFNGSNWTQMGTNEPEKLLKALTAMKVSGIDFATLNNPNTVSWFAQVISDQVIANTIKAINGFFNDITVDGNSTLKGNVDNFAFQTFTESESTKDVSLSFLVNNTSYAQLDIPGGTYRTRFINIKKIPINMTFKEIYRFWNGPAGEVYNAKSGSITVDGTTYSTSTHSITIMYNPMVFSIYAIPNGASDGGRIASFSFKTDNDYYPVDDTATIWIPTDSDVSASLKTSNKYTISSCSLVIETYKIAGAYIQNLIPKSGKDVMIGSPKRRVTQVNARDVAALTVIAYNKMFGQLGDNSCNDDVYANNLYIKGGNVSIGMGDSTQSTGTFPRLFPSIRFYHSTMEIL